MDLARPVSSLVVTLDFIDHEYTYGSNQKTYFTLKYLVIAIPSAPL